MAGIPSTRACTSTIHKSVPLGEYANTSPAFDAKYIVPSPPKIGEFWRDCAAPGPLRTCVQSLRGFFSGAANSAVPCAPSRPPCYFGVDQNACNKAKQLPQRRPTHRPAPPRRLDRRSSRLDVAVDSSQSSHARFIPAVLPRKAF